MVNVVVINRASLERTNEARLLSAVLIATLVARTVNGFLHQDSARRAVPQSKIRSAAKQPLFAASITEYPVLPQQAADQEHPAY